jgi:hypothetical protein
MRGSHNQKKKNPKNVTQPANLPIRVPLHSPPVASSKVIPHQPKITEKPEFAEAKLTLCPNTKASEAKTNDSIPSHFLKA